MPKEFYTRRATQDMVVFVNNLKDAARDKDGRGHVMLDSVSAESFVAEAQSRSNVLSERSFLFIGAVPPSVGGMFLKVLFKRLFRGHHFIETTYPFQFHEEGQGVRLVVRRPGVPGELVGETIVLPQLLPDLVKVWVRFEGAQVQPVVEPACGRKPQVSSPYLKPVSGLRLSISLAAALAL